MRDPHGCSAHALAPADLAVDVEGDGLVLGFFERVPHEQRAHAVVADLRTGSRLREQCLGQRRGVVLERRREAQMEPLVVDALSVGEQPPHVRTDRLGGIAELGEPVVQDSVFAAVPLLLAEEPLDVRAEGGVGDVITGPLDRSYEVILTIGEHGGQHGENVTHHDVAVGGEVLRQILEAGVELHGPHGNGS